MNWRSRMAERFVYIYESSSNSFKKENIKFNWYPGFSVSQKQRSIHSLHKEFKEKFGNLKVLEVSTASEEEFGKECSAFNLQLTLRNGSKYSVESLFQSSKVFKNYGRVNQDLDLDAKVVKRQVRSIEVDDKLIEFDFLGVKFPLLPRTYFYNWLYVNALFQNTELSNFILQYDAFTDINFNPNKSINCQAEACSIFLYLAKNSLLNDSIRSPKKFLELVYRKKDQESISELGEIESETETDIEGEQLTLF